MKIKVIEARNKKYNGKVFELRSGQDDSAHLSFAIIGRKSYHAYTALIKTGKGIMFHGDNESGVITFRNLEIIAD